MRSKLYLTILVLFLLSTASSTFSQGIKLKDAKGFTKHERLSLLGSLGLSTYYGDLCDAMECMKFRPNFGIGAMYRITNRISDKTEFNYYRLYAEDYYKVRALDFRSGNFELYTSLVFDIFPYTKHYRKRKLISPYIFAGVGLTYYNPKGKDPQFGSWKPLRPLQTENISYSAVTPILPFGGGVRIKFRRDMEFMVELGYRKTFTDYLDDVSSENYKPLETLSSDDSRKLSMKSEDPYYSSNYTTQQRGNPTKKDGYFIANVKFRYIVGTSKTHFKGKHPLLKPHHN